MRKAIIHLNTIVKKEILKDKKSNIAKLAKKENSWFIFRVCLVNFVDFFYRMMLKCRRCVITLICLLFLGLFYHESYFVGKS